MPITAYALVSPLGVGRRATLAALRGHTTGLVPAARWAVELPCYIGRVEAVDAITVPAEFAAYDCRNHRLAELALLSDDFAAAVERAARRYGRSRVGLFLGTSTSGVAVTEEAYCRRGDDDQLPPFPLHTTHSLGALIEYVGRRLRLTGPAYTVSTACSSSAKVFAVARRQIAAGLCDAAVVGGVDSFCRTTLYGFHALELVSAQPTRPWGKHRDGLSLGEGAGLALLERDPAEEGAVALIGVGESSDAYHMSSPHPEGAGGAQAITAALADADCAPEQIDYVNLHGTGTPANDRAEDRAVTQVFGTQIDCSSTKGATGHTLGAAGAIEALFCALSLESGWVPGGVTETELDPELQTAFVTRGFPKALRRTVSISLGFGGSNCALVLARRG
nr:beta-ketoacyl-ACP synthase [Halorhodospira abdelmalekii]